MLVLNDKVENKIGLSATLEEIYLLSLWIKMYVECNGDVELHVTENGCDIIDYYGIEIIFDTGDDEDGNRFMNFIKSLSQESNFGGVRENEYWITGEDVASYEL
jgi:hypothetical protein